MKRQEAIGMVVDTWRQMAGEFCVGRDENDQSDRECRDVLDALGVTPDEIKKVGL